MPKFPWAIPPRLRHGEALSNWRTKEYIAWKNMKRRCDFPNGNRYHRYGGRGIQVCPEWINSFETFLKDVGRAPSAKHQLDRINNNLNYEPGNVKWSTRKTQLRNFSKNRLITFRGETKTLVEWSEITGLHRNTIAGRIDNYGWSIEDALTVNPVPPALKHLC